LETEKGFIDIEGVHDNIIMYNPLSMGLLGNSEKDLEKGSPSFRSLQKGSRKAKPNH